MSLRAYDWIAHHARNTPHQLAVHDLTEQRTLSYAQFDERISRLAAWLSEQGVGHGDRAGVLAQNCSDMLELQFACGRLGAIFVPLNWRLTLPELRFIVGDAAPRVLIHDPEFGETAQALTLTVEGLVTLERQGPASDYEAALAASAPLPRSRWRRSRSMMSRPSCTPRAPRVDPRAR